VREKVSDGLMGLTFVLAVLAGPLMYVSQVIVDEDAFVAVADRIVAHPEVRRAVAEEVTTLSFEAFAADEAVADALPDRLRSIAVPLTRIAAEQITDAAFAVLDTDAAVDARDSALRELHRQATADVDGLTIDLRAVLVRTARELGGPTLGVGTAKLLSDTDAGIFVLAEPNSANSRLLDSVRTIPDVGAIVALLMLAALTGGMAAAKNRRRALVRGGLALAGGALVSFGATSVVVFAVLAPPGRSTSVGIGVAEVLVSDFAQQQRGAILSGVALSLIGLLLGQRPAAVALRRLPGELWQRKKGIDRTVSAIIGDNPPLARMILWLLGLLVCLGWPSPTLRVVVTLIVGTLALQIIIWVFSSAGLTAATTRERLGVDLSSVRADIASTSRVRCNVGLVSLGALLLWPEWGRTTLIGFFVVGAVLQVIVDLPGARRVSKAAREVGNPIEDARSPLRVNLAIGSVALVALLGVLSTLSVDTATATASGCNGYDELCDRRIDEVVFAGSHNSMSSVDLGWDLAMQSGDIIAQLDHGVRALLIDTHYWAVDSGDGTGVEGGSDAAAASVIEAALADTSPQPGTWLCHGFCALGATDFEGSLAEIEIWLSAHPREVLIIVIQDEISTADTIAAFDASGLSELVYNHQPGTPWPTLGELVASNERVLVYAENEGQPDSWYQNMWDTAFTETPFAFAVPSDFSCDPNRGDPSNPLFLLNHWLTTGIPVKAAAETVNRAAVLLERVEQCRVETGRLPTILAVDFVETGDLVSVVDQLNGVEPE